MKAPISDHLLAAPRVVVLDTETTGLDPKAGHKIIEIGCVELKNRRSTGRHYHQYINPQREIDAGAIEVHGITNEYLADKPVFAEVAAAFSEFVGDSPLVIHNAPFDVGFINHEFGLLKPAMPAVDQACEVIDTLVMARKMRPGQKNGLDTLCRVYSVDNSKRELHGALLDAQLLAEVFLAMTGGQHSMELDAETPRDDGQSSTAPLRDYSNRNGRVIRATSAELHAHEALLAGIEKEAGHSLWNPPVAKETSADKSLTQTSA